MKNKNIQRFSLGITIFLLFIWHGAYALVIYRDNDCGGAEFIKKRSEEACRSGKSEGVCIPSQCGCSAFTGEMTCTEDCGKPKCSKTPSLDNGAGGGYPQYGSDPTILEGSYKKAPSLYMLLKKDPSVRRLCKRDIPRCPDGSKTVYDENCRPLCGRQMVVEKRQAEPQRNYGLFDGIVGRLLDRGRRAGGGNAGWSVDPNCGANSRGAVAC